MPVDTYIPDQWIENSPVLARASKQYIVTEDKELRELALLSMYNTQLFAKTFMAEDFDAPMTEQTTMACRMQDDDSIPKGGICGWRGLGKTSIFEAKVTKDICFRRLPFLMYVSKTHDFSVETT